MAEYGYPINKGDAYKEIDKLRDRIATLEAELEKARDALAPSAIGGKVYASPEASKK